MRQATEGQTQGPREDICTYLAKLCSLMDAVKPPMSIGEKLRRAHRNLHPEIEFSFTRLQVSRISNGVATERSFVELKIELWKILIFPRCSVGAQTLRRSGEMLLLTTENKGIIAKYSQNLSITGDTVSDILGFVSKSQNFR